MLSDIYVQFKKDKQCYMSKPPNQIDPQDFILEHNQNQGEYLCLWPANRSKEYQRSNISNMTE